ncbi:MAG: phosphoadenosine phosphosulfate reductase family protein, partial [Flavobacteriales bacterium]|nr:phosphoadenosine phosphosulfate reductase family protein [Flavobacteriales bacterium]
FHPLLYWTDKDIYQYRMAHDLPEHPLEQKGYFSIGCEPCTIRIDTSSGRDGRWFGMNKTECGLHLELKEGLR